MSFKILLALGLLAVSMASVANNNVATGAQQQALEATLNQSNKPRLMQSNIDSQVEQTQLSREAQQKIQQFAATLKTALVTAIQTNGLAHAVDVCHTTAPEIAQSLSTDGWNVARTSLKTRNDKNQPDTWEADVLKSFDSQFKAGVKLKELNASLHDQAQFRYMQAIPTGQVCLACHGVSVDAALNDAIIKKYPNDRATGFTLEDIRGAFTLSKDLKD
jgi:hypothetical protein